MWIIGLLLLAAAVVVGIEIGISNDQQIDIEAFNHVWTSNPAAAFLVGVVTAVVGCVRSLVDVGGMRHSRVRHRDRRAEIAERDRLADERRREIEAMRGAGSTDDGVPSTSRPRPSASARDSRPRMARETGPRRTQQALTAAALSRPTIPVSAPPVHDYSVCTGGAKSRVRVGFGDGAAWASDRRRAACRHRARRRRHRSHRVHRHAGTPAGQAPACRATSSTRSSTTAARRATTCSPSTST